MVRVTVGMGSGCGLVYASSAKVTRPGAEGRLIETKDVGGRCGGKGRWNGRRAIRVMHINLTDELGVLGLPDDTISREELAFSLPPEVVSSCQRSLRLLPFVLRAWAKLVTDALVARHETRRSFSGMTGARVTA